MDLFIDMDSVQKILIAVVISLTALLIIVGVQVVLIISDLRKAVRRLNSILEDSVLGGGLIRPEKISGVLELFKKNKKLNKLGDGDVQTIK